MPRPAWPARSWRALPPTTAGRREFLAGIPGTVGGALAMNAGCHGGETWAIVDRVLMLDRQGELRERRAEDFAFGYRHVGCAPPATRSSPPPGSACRPGDGEVARGAHRELLEKAHRQPAAATAERRLGVPQSAGRSCRAPDRGGGLKGARSAARRFRRSIRISSLIPRARHGGDRNADRPGAGGSARKIRRRTGARSAHRRREGRA
jgi:hypothetical protein